MYSHICPLKCARSLRSVDETTFPVLLFICGRWTSDKDEFDYYWTNMHNKLKSFSHPALMSTPPTTRREEAWTQQVRDPLVWLKLGITTSETLPLSLATVLLGRKRLSRRHCIWTACPMTTGQLSLIMHVAVTGDPKGTTGLDVWTFAHGCLSSSK